MTPRRIKKRHLALAVYALLIAASHIVTALRPPALMEPGAAFKLSVQAQDARGSVLAQPVTLAYNDSANNTRPVVMLLHGSPGSASNFDRLAPLIRVRYRVISIDLPGFGGSTLDAPDYSFAAHARYVLALMDRLSIQDAHLVGFSMGGGVALSLADFAPQRVRSIVMLSAIGAQEFELLGDYHLNHAVHGLQLGALWAVYHGLPHFGALPNPLTFARNFYDSDQRPLRAIMQRYGGPMLIIQGREDLLVPFQAASEHARLAPQAELMLIESSHFMVFEEAERTAGYLLAFFDKVEAGSATLRRDASPARAAAALQALHVTQLPKVVGVALFATAVLLVVATFASEDLACISAGVLAAQGRIDLTTAILACFAGIWIGDVATMLAGRWLGRSVLTRAPLRWWIKPADVERATHRFAKRETSAIFVSRFVPGARVATYFTAGMLSKRPWWIVICLALAAALWTPLLVGASMLLGKTFVERLFTGNVLVNLALAALAIAVLLRLARALATHRGRRLLAGAWARWTQWEFWPMWLFYPPVVAYIVWLTLRHRGLTFTAANPAIPASGLVGESKIDILRALNDSEGFVARSDVIRLSDTLEQRVERAHAFMARLELSYPVALKPDIGERGSGVSIARDDAQLEAHLRDAREDTIIQEYVPGHEFGVFYLRRPGDACGRIFRITDKRMPVLTGDGVRTLGQLILDDPRAVAMAEFYIEQQGEAAERVPAAGERVQLVELGTHSRGAIFLDGAALATAALEAAVERVSRRFDGFFFGRYDIRTPDLAAFQRGEGFKIIELNGVTSEATSIYDPKHSLFDAYRTLFEQWRLAFEIGSANLRAGTQPLRWRQLLRLLRTRRLESSASPAQG